MSLLLDVPSSLERERAVNAVRSNLSPDRRYSLDRKGYKSEHQNTVFQDAIGKQASARLDAQGQSRTDKEIQLGNPLHSSVIIPRLLKLNSGLWFERSNARPELMGIYIQDSLAEEGRRFLMGFESGISPEFATVIVDKDGETKKLIQGWRTVLARLAKLRLISSQKSWMLFGPPSRGSKAWQDMGMNA